MRQLVIGLGEVGAPLREVLGVDGYDAQDPAMPSRGYDVLHIAFPWSASFVQDVRRYGETFAAAVTLVHATVPIGTTAQIPGAVHSPVLGRHATMKADLRRFPKALGGRNDVAATCLERAGMRVMPFDHPEQTEALKLLDLAKYGVQNAMARYAHTVAAKVGLTDSDLLDWDRMVNEHLPPALRRALIVPDDPDHIGGHCVVPGARLLARDHPHELLAAIGRYA